MLLTLALPTAALAKRSVYVVGDSSDNVAALDVGVAGFLTPTIGSPFAAGADPVSVAMTPDGRRAYVTNAGTVPPSVSAYNVTPTGGLAPIAGSFFVGTLPLGNAVTPNGRFMYVNNRGSKDVSAFEIHGTGALTVVPGSPFPVLGSPTGIALSADGRFLYTQNEEGTVSALTVGADGTLGAVPGTPFASGGIDTWAGAVTPDGRFLYVVNQGSNTLSAFAVGADGSLALLPGFPVASGGPVPSGIAIAPDGRHLYAMTSTTVAGFAISPAGGLAPVPGSPVALLGARSGALTPDGSRLYVAVSGIGKSVAGFAVGADGSLTALNGSPFEAGVDNPDVQALAIAPNQGPTASFSSTVAGDGKVVFNGSASADPDGTVARYDWDFGDGATAPNGGVAPSHTYKAPSTYAATLTVTDDEGCSASFVFTGQTASCNGGPAARFKADVAVAAPPPSVPKPKLTLRGGKVQRLGKWIVVTVVSDVEAKLVASGRLLAKPAARGAVASKAGKRSFRLGGRTASAKAGKVVKLKLRVPRPARRAAAKALASGGKARAKLTVKATDGGKTGKAKRTVKLRE